MDFYVNLCIFGNVIGKVESRKCRKLVYFSNIVESTMI